MDWQKDNESDGVYIFFLTQVVLYLRASELNSVQKGRVSTLGQFTLTKLVSLPLDLLL